MENLQLQNAYGSDLPLPLAYDEDDPVVSFCLDSTEEGLLYAATSSGTVHCFAQHGKKVRVWEHAYDRQECVVWFTNTCTVCALIIWHRPAVGGRLNCCQRLLLPASAQKHEQQGFAYSSAVALLPWPLRFGVVEGAGG